MKEKTHPCAYNYRGWCNVPGDASGADHFDAFDGIATCGFLYTKDASEITCDHLVVNVGFVPITTPTKELKP